MRELESATFNYLISGLRNSCGSPGMQIFDVFTYMCLLIYFWDVDVLVLAFR